MLPQNVKKIHMNFNVRMKGGHFGARKFWQNALPRLKYHNPAVSMTIDRVNVEEGPATLTVYFGIPPSATSKTSSPDLPANLTPVSTEEIAAYDRTEVIDMRHKRDSEILSQLMDVTKAIQILPSPEDEAELQKLKDENEKSRQESLINSRHLEKKREKGDLLAMARGVMAV